MQSGLGNNADRAKSHGRPSGRRFTTIWDLRQHLRELPKTPENQHQPSGDAARAAVMYQSVTILQLAAA